jgi:hypothetical protein
MFSQLPEELLAALKSWLFGQIERSYSALSEPCAMMLARAQSALVVNFFPDRWPDFFEFLFHRPPLLVSRFLYAFSIEMSNYDPRRFASLIQTKRYLTEAGICSQLIQYFFRQLDAGDSYAFKSMPFLTNWIPFSWIFDSAFSNKLLNGLQLEENARFVFDCFTSILEKEFPEKMSLISSFFQPNRICEYANRFQANLGILLSLSDLVSIIGLFCLRNNVGDEFFQLALDFLMIHEDVAMHLFSYLYAYLSQKPEVTRIGVRRVIERIKGDLESLRLRII